MPGARGRLTTLVYRAGSRAAQLVPGSIATPAGRVIGRAAAPLLPAQRAMAARHQARACAGANGSGANGSTADGSSVRGVFESYGRYWVEMLRLPGDVRAGAIPKLGRIEDFHHVTEGLAAGKGVILALPHLGGWEWAGAWMADQGYDILAVVERIEPPELLDWFARQRAALGMEVVALGPDVSTRVLRAFARQPGRMPAVRPRHRGRRRRGRVLRRADDPPGRACDPRPAHRGDVAARRGLLSTRPRPSRCGAAASPSGA